MKIIIRSSSDRGRRGRLLLRLLLLRGGKKIGDIVIKIELVELRIHLGGLRVKLFQSITGGVMVIGVVKFIIAFSRVDLILREVELIGERV